ncbi:MAG: hypothetical protein ACRD29_14755 [Acidimicrobiales bacterium]
MLAFGLGACTDNGGDDGSAGDNDTTTTTTADPAPTTADPDPTTTSPPTSTTPTTRKPADADTPAAGVCPENLGPVVVEVVIHPDIPSPRCTQVTAEGRLQVQNDSGQEVTVALADFEAVLAPGAAELFDRPFGEYLEPGVHRVRVSLYGESGPEIWLMP